MILATLSIIRRSFEDEDEQTFAIGVWAAVASGERADRAIGGCSYRVRAASSTIMRSASHDKAGMAASIEEVSYELGGAVGVIVAHAGAVMTLAITLWGFARFRATLSCGSSATQPKCSSVVSATQLRN